MLDNADEVGYVLEPGILKMEHRTLTEVLLPARRCSSNCLFVIMPSLLATSRSQESAPKLVEDRDIITVQPMDSEDASSFLR